MIQEISDEIFYFDVNRVIDVMQIAIHLRLKITISIHRSIKIDFFPIDVSVFKIKHVSLQCA